jgi:O-antigen ligase
VLLFCIIAVTLGRVHELMPFVARVPVAKILIPLGWLALLSRPQFSRRLGVLKTTQGKMFGLFVLAMFLSIPFSLFKGGSLQAFTDFLMGTASAGILVALACADARELYTVVRAMAVSGGVLGLAVLAGSGELVEGRAFAGTTYDPNDMAMVAVTVLPLAVWMLGERSHVWRWVGVTSAGGSLAAIVLSASRGGMLGLIVVLPLIAFFLAGGIPVSWRMAGVAVLALGLIAAPATFWERLKTLEDPSNDYNVTAPTGRVEIWKRGWGYYTSRPLTGVGLDQFGTAEGDWAERELGSMEGFKWSVAHNMWIQVLAELGTLGIVGFVGLYLPTLRDALRSRRRTPSRAPPPDRFRTLGWAIASSIAGFFVAGTFVAVAYSSAAMILAAVGMAYSHASRPVPAARPAAPGVPRRPRLQPARA